MSLLFPDRIQYPAAVLPDLTDKERIQGVIDLMERLLHGEFDYAHERHFAKSLKEIAELVKERL